MYEQMLFHLYTQLNCLNDYNDYFTPFLHKTQIYMKTSHAVCLNSHPKVINHLNAYLNQTVQGLNLDKFVM